MKRIILVFSILLLIGCKSKKVVNTPEPEVVKMVKLKLSEVNQSQKSKADE